MAAVPPIPENDFYSSRSLECWFSIMPKCCSKKYKR
jgi:hypothetical protein